MNALRGSRPILAAAPGGVQVLGRPDLGDALVDAANKARADVDAAAGDYALPQPAKTQAQAIRAYILLMRSAALEDKTNAWAWKKRANEAAWKFTSAGASVLNILQTALDLLSTAPRTKEVAKVVYRSSVGRSTTPRRRSSGSSSTSRSAEPVVDTAPAVDVSALPSWAPWAAGGVAALAALILLWPSRRS